MVAHVLLARRYFHGVSLSIQMRDHVAPHLPPKMAKRLRSYWPSYPVPYGKDWLKTPLISERGNRIGAFALASQSLGVDKVSDLSSLCLVLTHAAGLQMLLHWEDRNSMAHSVEARVPFLDHRLVEFCLALGNNHKIAGGETKRVMRLAMRGILPEVVRKRRDKLGFATPEQIWFQGPLRNLVVDGVKSTIHRYPELFNAEETITLMESMLDGRRQLDFTLWRIVNLGIWGERFKVSL